MKEPVLEQEDASAAYQTSSLFPLLESNMEDSLKASFGVQIIDQDVEPSLPFNNSLF